jgi:hypothetical protein
MTKGQTGTPIEATEAGAVLNTIKARVVFETASVE